MTNTKLILACLSILFPVFPSGQATAQGGANGAFLRDKIVQTLETESSEAVLNFAAPNLAIDWYQADVAKKVTLDLGMTQVADIQELSATVGVDHRPEYVGKRFLFIGANGTDGYILILGYDGTTFKIEASQSYPGRVLTSGDYSIMRQQMYVLDATNRVILRAPFNPASAVLPTPTEWVQRVTKSQCAGLQDVSRRAISIGYEDGGGELGLLLGTVPGFAVSTHWSIWDRDSGIVCEEHMGSSDYPSLDSGKGPLVAGSTLVEISGKAGETFKWVSALTKTVYASGTVAANGRVMLVVPALVMGDVYGVRSDRDGLIRGPFATPVKQWGINEVLPSGFSIEVFPGGRALMAEVGADVTDSRQLPPSLRMKVSPTPPTGNLQWSAWLIMGTEADIVAGTGGQQILNSGLSFSTTANWVQGRSLALACQRMALSNDTNLAGGVICMQWMILEGGQLYFSRIVGIAPRLGNFDASTVNAATATQSSLKITSAPKNSRLCKEHLAAMLMRQGIQVQSTKLRSLIKKRLK